jgi:hypothetical protein
MKSIEKLIHETIDEINEQVPPDQKLAKRSDAIVVGAGSPWDSLGIINFLVSLEARVAASTGRSLILVDESLLGDPDGPLRTVASIERYIVERVNG